MSRRTTEKRRVFVLAPYPYIETSPGLRNMITCLAENGFIVDLFTIRNSNYMVPAFENDQISVHIFPWVFQKVRRGSRGTLFLLSFVWWSLKSARRKKYKFVCGVGLKGLILSGFISKIFSIHLIYCSMELYVRKDARRIREKLANFAERICIRQARYVVIQDENRAQICATENRIGIDRFIIFPNSGFASVKHYKADYLNNKFGISNDKKVVLTIGALSPVCMVLELIKSAQNWPGEWVLVVHSKWSNIDPDVGNYLSLLKEADRKKRVVFSLKGVSHDELDMLTVSADIGVALYNSDYGENISAMGLSSGKIAQYLRCGLPIVVSSFQSLIKVIEKYKCGIPVADATEVEDAIREIMSEYDSFSNGSAQCFDALLSLEQHAKLFLDKINGL